jgi:polar amino acid transport system substrate-binding protein
MKKLLWFFILGLVLFSLIITSCSNSSTTSTAVTMASLAPMNIVVASDATWPPFESINEQNKQIEGMDIDIFNAIAEEENLQVEFKNVAWDPLLAGMAQGLYDAAISSITITEDRKKDMLFSDPYFAAGQLITVRKDNTTITGKDTLKGKVAVQLGTTGDIEVKKIAGVTDVPYDDIGLAFQDLMNGQVDAVVCDNPVALLYAGKNPDKLKNVGNVFTDESYGIAVAKGKTELLSRINAGLKAIQAEGVINTAADKWLKNPTTPTASLAPMNIVVASDATWPPFESINEQTKQIEGMDIDIFNAIAEEENLQVEFKNVAWDPLLAGMAQGLYDAAISSITITEDRKKDMLFSDPYFAAGQLITVQKDNTTITGKDTLQGKVAVQLGTTGDIEVKKIAGVTDVPYDDIGLAFQDLMNGQVDAVVCDNPVALLYAGKNPDKLKNVGNVFTEESYGIAVAKGKTELLSRINAGLKAIQAEGVIDTAAKKWLK